MIGRENLKALAAELRAHREFSEGSAGADWSEVDVCLKAADAIEALVSQLPYALTQAERDVLDERRAQRTREGFDAAHDDAATGFQLAMAAECYVRGAVMAARYPGIMPGVIEPGAIWPWATKWWKPGPARRMLVKAGALIFAELDRQDRAAAKKGGAA